MLDDRVAVPARLQTQQEAHRPHDRPPLFHDVSGLAVGPQEATTPTGRKEIARSDCAGKPGPREGSGRQQRNGDRVDRWSQARTRVRRLVRADGGGRGGAPSEAPRTLLHRDFWLEALDDQHRYGCYLRAFHKAWKHAHSVEDAAPSGDGGASFFCWLDHGEGSALDLPECSQQELRCSQVEYCSRAERRRYELRFVAQTSENPRARPATSSSSSCGGGSADASCMSYSGGFVAEYAESHALAHTDERSKWIFVVDLAGRMYLGRKRKGRFHHSSFVAGAPVIAAGKVVIKAGRILAIEPHSGHFKPKLASLGALRAVLERNGVDVDAVAFVKPKKWADEWPFPALEASVDLDDFASDTDECGSNAVFGRLDDPAADEEDGRGDEQRWLSTSPKCPWCPCVHGGVGRVDDARPRPYY